MIAESWRARWEHIVPFLSLPADLRRAVYTTNSIENLNRQIRKSIKTHGHSRRTGRHQLIYLAIGRAERKWRKGLPLDWRAPWPQDPLRRPTARLT
jgi:putative transposase